MQHLHQLVKGVFKTEIYSDILRAIDSYALYQGIHQLRRQFCILVNLSCFQPSLLHPPAELPACRGVF